MQPAQCAFHFQDRYVSVVTQPGAIAFFKTSHRSIENHEGVCVVSGHPVSVPPSINRLKRGHRGVRIANQFFRFQGEPIRSFT
jgi:hypothetical protein